MNKDELRTLMAALPEPVTDKQPPYWEYWRWELWQHVANGDDPSHFWEWPCIYHTMLQQHWLHLVRLELEHLYGSSWNADFILGSVSFPKNGPFDDVGSYVPVSANLIKQLYHLNQWEKTTGQSIADLKTIVEFGGGYGAMALLVYRLGFKGTYYIIDLPEFQKLQEYYLSNTGETVNVEWIEKDNEKLRGLKPDLLVALYSLSEVPYSLRDEILDRLKAKSHLLLFSNRFADYDNVKYFSEYSKRVDRNWKTWVIEHMPPESLYTIGW